MATLKFYRCNRPTCMGREMGRFWATYPKCPQCSLDANDPKYGNRLARLVIVHFDPPTDFPGMGMNTRACEPTREIYAPDGPGGVPNPWHLATGSIAQVNCLVCMATEAYRVAKEAIDDDEPAQRKDDDEPVLTSSTKAALNRIQEVAGL